MAVGSMVSTAEHVREKLKEEGYTCSLVNGRFVKPFDRELVARMAKNHSLIVTLEENVLRGGYGERITDYVQKHYPAIRVVNIALPDAYVEHGNVSKLRSDLGIDSDSILIKLKNELKSEFRVRRKTDERTFRCPSCQKGPGRVQGKGKGDHYVRHRLCG